MNRKKILLVDDDKDLLKGLDFRLRAQGYETVIATDGYLAMSVAQKEKPDLIILDLGLPVGDGFTVMERMGRSNSLGMIPIIVFSARDSQINRERAMKAGAIAFFQKPADNDNLLAAIKKAMGKLGEQTEEPH